MKDLFGDEPAKRKRDKALKRVADRSGRWMQDAMGELVLLPVGWTGIGEALRDALLARGLRDPHHHNAWGAFINVAQRKGLIRKTNQWRHMTGTKSHARMSPVYVRTTGGDA